MDKDKIAELLYKTKEILDNLSHAVKYDNDFPAPSGAGEIDSAKINILKLEEMFKEVANASTL